MAITMWKIVMPEDSGLLRPTNTGDWDADE
jgi:hypothetical protein